jgi:hypothetical protein
MTETIVEEEFRMAGRHLRVMDLPFCISGFIPIDLYENILYLSGVL